jgi:hypothetical protein
MTRSKLEVTRRQLGARVNKDTIKKLKLLAIDKELAFNVLIEEIFEDFLQKHRQKQSRCGSS